ncbi:MAG: hypothetical protein K2Q06_10665, partial [Parvularculaceae bacterium]|nr:hypothetical protein [Parvularculaceae bacterium]
FPHERSNLSHWRGRMGDRLDRLLAESLRVAHGAGALKTDDLARVTVDTTVMPKAVAHPSDARLLLTAIEKLVCLAKENGVVLRQSYVRLGVFIARLARVRLSLDQQGERQLDKIAGARRGSFRHGMLRVAMNDAAGDFLCRVPSVARARAGFSFS